jgi:restriction system protein
MATPGFQEFMLPFLRIASDGEEHSLPEAVITLAEQMRISEEERNSLLSSGQTRVYNRVAWAMTYLSKSLLIEKTGRGRFKISARGVDVLKKEPTRIDNRFLEQFAEYRAFKKKRRKNIVTVVGMTDDDAKPEDLDITPDEQLDVAYKELRETLADELLHRVRAGSPKSFEHLVVELLVAMGYGGGQVDRAEVTGKSGDEGIDGIIQEDRLGLDMVYVQAKKWDNSVGPGEIDRFVGSLMRKKATKGVFITSGTFTDGARRAAREAALKVRLIDGEELSELMIDFNVGVAASKTYTIKKVDNDFFEETV